MCASPDDRGTDTFYFESSAHLEAGPWLASGVPQSAGTIHTCVETKKKAAVAAFVAVAARTVVVVAVVVAKEEGRTCWKMGKT